MLLFICLYLRYFQLLRSQDETPFSSGRRHGGTSNLNYSVSQDNVTPDNVLNMNWEAIWSQALKDSQRLCEVLFDAIKIPLSVLRAEKAGEKSKDSPFIHPALLHRESFGSRKSSSSSSSSSITTDKYGNVSSSPSIEFNEISDSDDSSDESDSSSDEDDGNGNSESNSSGSSQRQRRKWKHKPEVFELACKLLYMCESELLPYFVDYVSRGADSSHLFVRGVPISSTYFPSRALSAIPFMDSGLQSLHLNSVDKNKVKSIANVMFMADKRLSGVMLVLRADLWDLVLDLIKRAQKDVPDSAPELFTAALYDCMEKRRPERLEQLWECIPDAMTPLDIVHTMSVFVSQQGRKKDESDDEQIRPPILVNPEQNLTVGMFQGPLIKLIRMHK